MKKRKNDTIYVEQEHDKQRLEISTENRYSKVLHNYYNIEISNFKLRSKQLTFKKIKK